MLNLKGKGEEGELTYLSMFTLSLPLREKARRWFNLIFFWHMRNNNEDVIWCFCLYYLSVYKKPVVPMRIILLSLRPDILPFTVSKG